MNLLSFSKQLSFLNTSDRAVLPARRESLVQLNMIQTDAVFYGAVGPVQLFLGKVPHLPLHRSLLLPFHRQHTHHLRENAPPANPHLGMGGSTQKKGREGPVTHKSTCI